MNIDYKYIIDYLWEKITFEMFFKFVLVYFFIIWISLVIWVVKDIWNRTENIFLQLLSVLIILCLTPLWIFIYLIIRPSKTLFEKYYEEIDTNLDTVEDIVEDKNIKEDESMHCYKCNYPVSLDFSFCPNCSIKLKVNCSSCNKSINTWWKSCPFCWAENKNDINIFSNTPIVENIKKEKNEIVENKILDVEEMIDNIIKKQDNLEKLI